MTLAIQLFIMMVTTLKLVIDFVLKLGAFIVLKLSSFASEAYLTARVCHHKFFSYMGNYLGGLAGVARTCTHMCLEILI